jgi:CheY-like chemotaxis protein
MSYKFLLIDDEAEKGWARVLKALLVKEFGPETLLDYALDEKSAVDKLSNKWNLIFLDIRFGEGDHIERLNPGDFTGTRILVKHIRQESNPNFPIPVILFTASRKIWNIDYLKDLGADDYYIKESPIDLHDANFSQANYIRFVENIKEYLKLGYQRSNIWEKTIVLFNSIKKSVEHPNIRLRIQEKLKIAYGILTQHSNSFERKNLLYANEIMAFIVYYSILEEISKDAYEKDWQDRNEVEWKILGQEKYLVKIKDPLNDIIEVGIKQKDNIYVKADPPREISLDDNDKDYIFWSRNFLFIREQIYGLLILKYQFPLEVLTEFMELNKIRNDLDFIHSEPEVIFNQSFCKNYKPEVAYKDCLRMFEFIYRLLI